jgi:hypothetical protein
MPQSPSQAVSTAAGGTQGRPTTTIRRQHLTLVYMALLSVIVLWTMKPRLRTVLNQLRAAESTSVIDKRYQALMQVLPSDRTLGYITDVAPSDPLYVKFVYQSQYALAPRILEHGTRPLHVVADLGDPSGLERLCRLHALRTVAAFPSGVALLEHQVQP